MKRALRLSVLSGMIAVVVSACAPAGASRTIVKGDELSNTNFSQPNSWEEGAYDGATLRIVDGRYRIDVTDGTGKLWWGQWGDVYRDVIIDADVTQVTERNEVAYGVMCRVRGRVGQPVAVDPELETITDATPEALIEPIVDVSAEATAAAPTEATAEATQDAAPVPTAVSTAISTVIGAPTEVIIPDPNTIPFQLEGDGYLFLIQGTGAGAILRARGRNVTVLADWRVNDAIVVGPGENHLRAVCVGDYLAFYVNETLVAEANDDAYSEGQVGMVASAFNRLGVRVLFDNLQISAAQGS